MNKAQKPPRKSHSPGGPSPRSPEAGSVLRSMGHAPTEAYTGPASMAGQGHPGLDPEDPGLPPPHTGGAQFSQEGPHLQTVPST